MLTALAKSSSLTDGSTRRLITPRERTVGTKASSTPNFLYSIAMVGKPPALVFGIGTGNSPPARKRAASPDSAIRFGSARRRSTPLVSKAVTRLSMDRPLLSLSTLVSRLPYGVAPLASVAAVLSRGRVLGGAP